MEHYVVNRQSVPSFTNRTVLQAQLDAAINYVDPSRSPPRSVALWGGPTMGKTQLALRYAELNRERYNTIIWIDATTPDTAINSFSEAFYALDLPLLDSYVDELRKDGVYNDRERATFADNWVVTAVLEWLSMRYEDNCEWLVIIDNADTLFWIQELIPRGPRGSVIITSRNKFVTDLARHTIEVQHMEVDEGINLLLYDIEHQNNEVSRPTPTSDTNDLQRHHAFSVAESLGRSPYLLDIMNHYVRNHAQVAENLSILETYLYDASFSLLEGSAQGPDGKTRFRSSTVYEKTLADIERLDNNSANVLFLIAVSSNGLIEDRLFEEAALGLAEWKRLAASWAPLLIWVQEILLLIAPGVVVRLFVAFAPWKPAMQPRTQQTVRRVVVLTPLIGDCLFYLLMFAIRRQSLEHGSLITNSGSLSLGAILMNIYIGVCYSWLPFAEWLLQQELVGFWFQSLPRVVPVVLFVRWLYLKFYYSLDDTLSHHLRFLLNRIDLSRDDSQQVDRAINELHDLSPERKGIRLPLELTWYLMLQFVVDILSGIIEYLVVVLYIWLVSRLRQYIEQRRQRRYGLGLTIAHWTTRILEAPILFVVLFIIGYGIGSTGILTWTPWASSPKLTVPTSIVDEMLKVHTDGSWDSRVFHERIAVLVQFGLVHRSPQLGYTMHGHLIWWLRHRLSPEQASAWVREGHRFLRFPYKSDRCLNDTRCHQMLIPHLIAAAGTDIELESYAYYTLDALLKMLYQSLVLAGRV